jgi:hypothetical protein
MLTKEIFIETLTLALYTHTIITAGRPRGLVTIGDFPMTNTPMTKFQIIATYEAELAFATRNYLSLLATSERHTARKDAIRAALRPSKGVRLAEAILDGVTVSEDDVVVARGHQTLATRGAQAQFAVQNRTLDAINSSMASDACVVEVATAVTSRAGRDISVFAERLAVCENVVWAWPTEITDIDPDLMALVAVGIRYDRDGITLIDGNRVTVGSATSFADAIEVIGRRMVVAAVVNDDDRDDSWQFQDVDEPVRGALSAAVEVLSPAAALILASPAAPEADVVTALAPKRTRKARSGAKARVAYAAWTDRIPRGETPTDVVPAPNPRAPAPETVARTPKAAWPSDTIMSATETIEQVMLASIPDDAPLPWLAIVEAVFTRPARKDGTGYECLADLTMFDGLPAEIHVGQRGADGSDTFLSWISLPGGDIEFVGGAWARVQDGAKPPPDVDYQYDVDITGEVVPQAVDDEILTDNNPTPGPLRKKKPGRSVKNHGTGTGLEGRVQTGNLRAMSGAMAAIHGLGGGFMGAIGSIVPRVLAEERGLPPPADDVPLRESGDALVSAAAARLADDIRARAMSRHSDPSGGFAVAA